MRRLSFGVLLLLWSAPLVAAGAIPISGTPVPAMSSYDTLATRLMAKYEIPGGAIAVVKDGRLVFAHGYGWSDLDRKTTVEPASLFRVASLSKAFTSAAVMKLVERGKLSLDTRVFDILSSYAPLPGGSRDPRLRKITVRELLEHSGGWNPDTTFDPMFRPFDIAEAAGVPPPAGQTAIIRYMLREPLQFDPGSQYAYSNFGYMLLGRVIEKVSGQRYEKFVKEEILRPAGVRCAALGHSFVTQRLPGEVHYYDYPGAPLAKSVNGRGTCPWPDGGFDLEAMDAHGGWVASTIDYLRFVTAVDGFPSRRDVLSPQSIATMTAHPPAPLWAGSPSWYAFGWMVRPANGGANWWHNGSLPGTSTLVVRAYNGVAWVAFFNSRPKNSKDFESELDKGLWDALAQVRAFPAGNQFSSFSDCAPAPRRPGH